VKLSRQLALAFAGVAAAPVLAASPLVLHTVAETVEGEVARRRDAALRAVEGERRLLADEVDRGLEAAADGEIVRTVAARLRAGDRRGVVGAAGDLLRASSLDVLALLDADGRVISSGHLPARAGDRDPSFLGLAGTRTAPRVRRVELRTGEGIVPTLALVAAAPANTAPARPAGGRSPAPTPAVPAEGPPSPGPGAGEGPITVVAGKALDPGLARRLAAVAGARVDVLDLATGATVAAAGEVPAGDPPGPLERLALALVGDPALAPGTVDLPGPDGRPAARLVVAVDAGAIARAQARILAQAAGILLAAVLLAAALGALLARRLVGPIDALSRGAARVAGGDLATRVEARAGGELGALVRAFNSMTEELLRTRERAAVAERVAAWREVARRLAHEIKNPLAPIAMAMETLRDARRAKSPLEDELFESSSTTILAEVARLTRIVDEFSRFARLPPPSLAPVDLPEAVEQLLALHGPAEGVELRRELDPRTPTVLADRDQVVQVLVNLLDNAKAAVGGTGTIALRVGPAPGGGAFLEVEDSGPGVAPADRERIFEPYVTTKSAGTGLGLSIARRIAEEHGGRLEVGGDPGPGARFRLTLPARPDRPADEVSP
jgi:two-component system nitrogen regulation sensor histidine kinase NtrY